MEEDVLLGLNYSVVSEAAGQGPGQGPSDQICSYQELVQDKLSNATVALSVILLLVINAMVIAGNILVILAVFVSSKLRTSTNYFIVSLAMADLLVGVAVLPYSLTHEVLDVWVFGEVWCQGWLVVDVWLCTASILNLCAISVDRYLAVTRPVRYRSMMTSRRAKLVIAAVWVLSFLICFPPLVGWNGRTSFPQFRETVVETIVQLPKEQQSQRRPVGGLVSANGTTGTGGGASNDSLSPSLGVGGELDQYSSWLDRLGQNSSSEGPALGPGGGLTCPELNAQCTLFNEKGYVIYSALGSFYIPMLFMFFFYWRIYLVASRTTRALKRGYRTTKSTKSSKSSQGGNAGGTGAGSPEERLTLRIHRGYIGGEGDGGGSAGNHHHQPAPSPRLRSGLFNKPTIIETSHCDEGTELKHFQDSKPQNNANLSSNHANNPTSSSSSSARRKLPITLYRSPRLTAHLAAQDAAAGAGVEGSAGVHQLHHHHNGGHGSKDHNRLSPTPSINSNMFAASPSSPSSSREGSARLARFSRRANNSHTGKWQAKRFHAETKAAKTVGIIVGGFICCWFPFFTAYLIRAFCNECFPELLMSIFTWLGYCNSAINPIIYGLFSRDFRRAFKNIVCRCTCKEEVGVTSLIRQIHLPTFFEEDQMLQTDDIIVKSNDDEYK